MADTTALKNRIRAAIKANDNQEITGPVLQQTLLDIVDELSDRIIDEYTLIGIAAPTTIPPSNLTEYSRIFYLTAQNGVYTNLGGIEVSDEIVVIKYSGASWLKDIVVAIDDVPTVGSNNPVKSGGTYNKINTLATEDSFKNPFTLIGNDTPDRRFWESFILALEISTSKVPGGDPYPEPTTGWSIAEGLITPTNAFIAIYRSSSAWEQWANPIMFNFNKPNKTGIVTLKPVDGIYITVNVDNWPTSNYSYSGVTLPSSLNRNIWIPNFYPSIALYKYTIDIQQNTEDIFANSQIELKKHIDTLLDLQNIERVDWDKYVGYVGHQQEEIYLNLMRHSGKAITDIYYKTLGGETVFYLITTENGVYTNIEELQTNIADVRESPFIAHCKLDTPVILTDGQYIGIQYNFYYANDTVDDKAYNSVTIGSSVNYQKNSEIGYVVVDETLQGKSLIKDDALNLLSPADFIKNGGHVNADGSIQPSNILKNTGLVDVSSLYRVVASFQTQGIGEIQTQGISENYGPAIILYDEHFEVVKVYYAYTYTRNCLFDIFFDKRVKYMLINVYYNVNGADYTTYTCYGYKRIHVTKQQNVLYRKNFNSTVIYPEYTNAAAENFTNNGLLINSSTPIQLQRYYSLHTRTLRLLCKFNASTVAKIASNDGYSYITINGTAATITMHATTPITKNLSFYNSSHLYLIEITRNYEKNICTITDLNTSDSETIEHIENGTGGAGQGSVGVEESAGAWHDYYQFSATSGSFYIKELSISPLYGKVKTLIYGDSVTELLYYPQADYLKCWTQQFIAACVDRVMVSPRSGTSIGEILMRIPNELPYIDAEYVMITIGTNSGVSLESFSQLVEYIFKCGATPVLNHIPCNINGRGVSNHVEINAMIDQIREKYGIHGVDFDIATSINLDGQTVDTTKMYWEDYSQPTGSVYHHPNVKGSTAMMQQIKLDMPELLI